MHTKNAEFPYHSLCLWFRFATTLGSLLLLNTLCRIAPFFPNFLFPFGTTPGSSLSSLPAGHVLLLPGLTSNFPLGAKLMEWTTPQHEEIDLNCEVSSYANAEL
ncbi:MAG: hypothetical protein DMG44_05985 [Acidobacteria bacterium]|nr:MAG: hypothetical protein DMG44_05985 [Acidobacteriota bacterium]